MSSSTADLGSAEGAVAATSSIAHGKTVFERCRRPVSLLAAIVWVVGASATAPAFGQTSVTGQVLFAVGAMLTVIGMCGRNWCLTAIAGNKDRLLVTDGPYSLSRNPLYVFSLIGAIGVGLSSRTLTIPAIACLVFVFYYFRIIRREEARLAVRHGAAFEAYRQQVNAWLPRFSGYRPLTGNREVDMEALARGMTDSGWFVIAFVGLHLLSELRESQLLSTWWTLW